MEFYNHTNEEILISFYILINPNTKKYLNKIIFEMRGHIV